MRRAPSSLPAARIPSAFTGAATSCLPRAWAISQCSATRFAERRNTCASGTRTTRKSRSGDKDANAPKSDLKLEALADVLRGKVHGADPLLSRRRIPHRDGHGEGVWIQDSRLPSRARGLQSCPKNCRRRTSASPPSPTGGATRTKLGTRFRGTRSCPCAKVCASRSRATPTTSRAA